MRYRDYKNFHTGGFFHIYNRGHNKDLVFKDEEDYLFFIKRAKQILGLQKTGMSKWMSTLPEGSFSVLSYCLMPNHFHFLILQQTNLPTSKFISKLCTSYSIYFNKKYENIGAVFQGRFKAKLVDDDSYLTHLSVYIHKNPKQPFRWPYSSLTDYVGRGRDPLVDKDLIIKMTGGTTKTYKEFFHDYTNKDELQISHLTFDD
ncbi:MAG: transposase [Candidatus Yanofskybacteria bacterium]|nr:transposase [Candidatus Yanofskybacteria bacterium]